jgi:tetratricopeptide (TPR) repeat protein
LLTVTGRPKVLATPGPAKGTTINEQLSLERVIDARQEEQFVGRRERRNDFAHSIELPAGDPQRRHLFNIHGDAGIGKTSLARQLRRDAEARGAICGFADENSYDVPQTLASLAAGLDQAGFPLKRFARRYETYRDRRYQLEADPQAPPGTFEFITRMAVKTGLQLAKTTPGLALAAEVVDPAATADQAERLRRYLAKKIRKSDDLRLILSPTDVLTPLFLKDLQDVCKQRSIVLILDTFEQTSTFLEGWLFDVLNGRHGPVAGDLTFVVSGQLPLDRNRWIAHRSLIADVPLAGLAGADARELLGRLGVDDEVVGDVILGLSSGLPLLIAMLASEQPTSVAKVGDRTGDAVERFLGWVADDARRELAISAALPRLLNEDIFVALAGDAGRPSFDWLLRQPFITSSSGSGTYHDVVRIQVLKLRRTRSPNGWSQQHLHLAETFKGWRSELGIEDEDAAWADTGWQSNILEENYHRLCAAPRRQLSNALTGFIRSVTEGAALARRWARSIADAGRDTDDADLRFWGDQLLALIDGTPADVRRLFDELLSRAPIDVEAKFDALIQVGIQLRIFNDLPGAIDAFSRAARLKPDSHDAIFERGETYRLLEEYEKAIADLDRAIELGEPDAWALGSRGETHAALENYERALADLADALAIDPELYWGYVARANVLLQLDRMEEAQADLDRAVQVAPESAWPLIQRADLAVTRGEYDAAIADYTRANTVEPDEAWALTRRAELLSDLGRETEAIADLGRAIEIDPSDDLALSNRGALLGQKHRFAEALVDLDRAIEIDPDFAWALDRRGKFRYLSGDHQGALEDFSRSLDIDPEDASIRLARARTAMMLGLFEQVGADFEAIRPEFDDENAYLHYYHGLLLRWRRRPADAKKVLARALSLVEAEEADFDTELSIAVCQAAIGNWQQARLHLLRGLTPETDAFRQALRDELGILRRLPGTDHRELTALINLIGIGSTS